MANLFTKDLFGREPIKCVYCGYERNQPDLVKICQKCGGDLKTKEVPNYKIPRKWKRFLVFFIDLFFLGILLWFISYGLEKIVSEGFLGFIFILTYLAYFSFLPLFFVGTIGQMLFGIKTVDKRNLTKPTPLRLIVREILFLTIGSGIGLIFYLIKGFYWDRLSKITPIENK